MPFGEFEAQAGNITGVGAAAGNTGNADVITVLLKAGACTDARDLGSRTALHRAAQSNFAPEIVGALER